MLTEIGIIFIVMIAIFLIFWLIASLFVKAAKRCTDPLAEAIGKILASVFVLFAFLVLLLGCGKIVYILLFFTPKS